MSDIGNIITALSADVTTAVSGVTVGTDPINVDKLTSDDLPYCVLLQADYDLEQIEWGQERRTWTVYGLIVQDGGTREQMHTKLEALRDQIFADRTLGSSVDTSAFSPATPHSSGDAKRVFGEFAVVAEKVV